MKRDIIIAGVGGQGVLSISTIIAASALKEGLHVKQAEVHGMSQRGGAVISDLRLSDEPIHSTTIPRGRADVILSMEPLESLRYLEFLAPEGIVVSSTSPVVNIPDYPELADIIAAIEKLPRSIVVDADALASAAGSKRASNMVMVGAASASLPLAQETIEAFISETFARKGEKMVKTNIDAFRAGRALCA